MLLLLLLIDDILAALADDLGVSSSRCSRRLSSSVSVVIIRFPSAVPSQDLLFGVRGIWRGAFQRFLCPCWVPLPNDNHWSGAPPVV